RLGLTSPPSSVLCAATTATSPSRGLRSSLAFPIPCLLPCVCGLPYGLVSWWKRHGSRQGLWSPGPLLRVCHNETGGSPNFPTYPAGPMPRSQTPVGSCALAIPHPGLLPSGPWKPSAFLSVPLGEISCCPRRYTFRGSITRPASSLPPA